MTAHKLLLIHTAIDVSKSMYEFEFPASESGESKKKNKLEIAYENLRRAIEGLVTEEWDSVKEFSHRRYFSIGYFGEEGYDPSKTYLLMEPVSLKELKERYERGEKLLPFELDDLKRINGDGTDAGQLVASFEHAVRRLVEAHSSPERSLELRVTLLVFTDSCFNLYEGNTMPKPEEIVSRARSRLDEIAVGAGARWRGRIFVLYGDPARLEQDDGICPLRASYIASTMDELDRVRLKTPLENLERGGVLVRDPEWKDLESQGKPLREYAVWRIRDPLALAKAIITVTTA